LANQAMIGFDGIMQGDRAAPWLAQAVPSARIVNRNNSMLGSCRRQRPASAWRRCPPRSALRRRRRCRCCHRWTSWFLLTHPDLRRTPRIAAFVDHVLEDIPALRRALIG
jgi:hypothetical protein